MPYYIGQAQVVGGICGIAGSGGLMSGWATTSSSTTSSCMNPFYGATGGTGTNTTTTSSGWNECQTIWIETVTACGGSDEAHQHQLLNEAYQRQISQYNQALMGRVITEEEDRANALYEARYRAEFARQQAQSHARPQDAAAIARYQADAARQQDEFNRAEAEGRRVRAEQEEKRGVASKRARELLIGTLSPEQRETFTKNGWFVVEGGKSKKKYRIQGRGYQGNIDVLDARNNVQYRLCVHCSHDLPLEDHLLSQKTMLELAEDDIIKLANRHAA